MTKRQRTALEYGNKVRTVRMIDWRLANELKTKNWNGLANELKKLKNLYKGKLNFQNQ